MVDMFVFLDTQVWAAEVAMERVEFDQVVFEGNSCFVCNNADFLALKSVGRYFEPFSIPIRVGIFRGELYFEFLDFSFVLVCAVRVDLNEVQFLRMTRLRIKAKFPPHASFDFGKVKLRIWNSQPFALPLFRVLCGLEFIPGTKKKRPLLTDRLEDPVLAVQQLTELVSLLQHPQCEDGDFYDTITELLRIVHHL
ncbi:hypothetical protein BASA82_001076 [Batrachochytrium salamandrivorans]|nr:hypothetical protein BASA82_001076 [Batrachochytrium salamandrivorans]